MRSDATTRLIKRVTAAALWATLILLPFRLRFQIVSRQIGTLFTDYTDFLLFASDIALIVTLSLWLIGKRLTRERFRLSPRFLTIPLLLLIAISLLSVPGSIDPALSVYHVIRLALLTGLVFHIVDRSYTVKDLATPLAIQVGIQAVIAVSQFLRQSDLGLQALGEYDLDPGWQGVSIVLSDGQRWLRAYGLTEHPNILGGCLAVGLLVLLGAQLTSEEERGQAGFPAVFAMGTAALFLTFSRTGGLALLAGSLFLAIFLVARKPLRYRIRRLLIIGFSTLLVILPFVWAYSGLLVTRLPMINPGSPPPTEIQSLGERTLLIDASIEVFEQSPLLGSGIGTLPQAIRQHRPEFPVYYQPAHLTLIDAAAETGLMGATVYFVLLAAPWVMLAFSARRTAPQLLVASALLLGITVIGMFDYYPWLLAPGRLLQYVSWGLWGASYQVAGQVIHAG